MIRALLTFIAVAFLSVGGCYWYQVYDHYKHIHSDHVLTWAAWTFITFLVGLVIGTIDRKKQK